jgi:hypothetical protein
VAGWEEEVWPVAGWDFAAIHLAVTIRTVIANVLTS